jgi:hypothetical protein
VYAPTVDVLRAALFFRVLAVMHMHMMNNKKKSSAPPREHTIINQTGQLVTLFVTSVKAFLSPTDTPDAPTPPVATPIVAISRRL